MTTKSLSTAEHKCNFCDKVFSSPSQLKQHAIRHSNDKPFKCDFCKKSFKRKGHLSRHMERAHIKKNSHEHKCSICDKIFSSYFHVKQHVMVHTEQMKTNELKHKCNICDEIFPSPSQLKRHEIVHSDEGSFKCDFCEKIYRHKSSWSSHMEKAHIKKNRHEHKCKICDKVFSSYYFMKRHETVHTDERPFKCDFCVKSFKLKETCSRHMERVHNQSKRRYACEKCGKSYGSLSYLKQHTITVHIDKEPFPCDYCPKEFRYKHERDRHVKNVHVIVPYHMPTTLDLPVVEIKFEPDNDFNKENVQSLEEEVKKETIEDDDEFHITN